MALNRQINSLLLKSNRILETRLSESGLVTSQDLEEANRIFLSKVRSGDILEASLLRILIMETQKLSETKLLNYQLEHAGLGGVLLSAYQLREEVIALHSVDEFKATWSMPIDHYGDCTVIASCYILSDFVKQYWSDKIGHTVTWYATTIDEMQTVIQSLASEPVSP